MLDQVLPLVCTPLMHESFPPMARWELRKVSGLVSSVPDTLLIFFISMAHHIRYSQWWQPKSQQLCMVLQRDYSINNIPHNSSKMQKHPLPALLIPQPVTARTRKCGNNSIDFCHPCFGGQYLLYSISAPIWSETGKVASTLGNGCPLGLSSEMNLGPNGNQKAAVQWYRVSLRMKCFWWCWCLHVSLLLLWQCRKPNYLCS